MKFLKSVFLFLLTFAVTFIFTDFFIQSSEIMSVSFDQVHKQNGAMYKPNAQTMFLNEGFHLGQINNNGYLGNNYPPKKQDKSFRIALLGDSFVEGFQVFDRHHFRNLLESKLNKTHDYIDYEVLNFGRGEFNLSNTYAYHQNFVQKFQPDLTLIFLSKNDLFSTEANWTLKPYCYIDNDSLEIKKDVSDHPIYKRKEFINNFSNHIATLRLLSNCHRLVQKGLLPHIVFDKFNALFGNEKPEVKQEEQEVSKDELDETMLAILNKISQTDDFIFVFRDQEPFPKDIHNYISSLGIEIIDLSNPLMELKENNINPTYWEVTGKIGHWNHEGHKAVANHIYEKLLTIRGDLTAFKDK